MAPAVDSSFSRRSYSSPDLLSLPALDNSPSLSQSMSQSHLLINDKSLPSLTTFEIPSFNTDFELDTSLFVSDKHLSSDKPAAPVQSLSVPNQAQATVVLPRAKSATSLANLQESWMTAVKSAREAPEQEQRRPATSAKEKYSTDGQPKFSNHLHPLERSQTSTDTFATSTRRSWMSSSRSASPKSRPGSPVDKSSKPDMTASYGKMKRSIVPKRLEIAANQTSQNSSLDTSKPAPKSFARYFAKIKGKPASNSTKANESIGSNLSCASSAASLGQPTSTSIDTHGSSSNYSDTNVTTPSTTDESSIDMPPRMLDPQWSSFKTLEMEFRGFAAKPMPQKTSQIQSLILPFLKNTTNQAPINNLRPEDVDRRATIFNKWWGAILDILEGHYQQQVAGVDRPILLEAATMIMMRPEWRQTTSYFLPLSERSPKERVRSRSRSWTNASDTSESSSQSAMLAESAEHNVRTMFVSNLVKQMAFVVEKMSLRHAPLSLVNFAGKTCAYAFFFAPGVPDILVRLWGLTPDLIRRAGDEFKLPRKDSGESDDIVALFPPKLSTFGWTSPRTMWETLKHIPKMPMLVARIPWTGPWVSRWKGRDTDLFFIFCKYFHILSDQFMPSDLPLTEKARAPAFVLVHAQLLSTFDATIHRQNTAETPFGSPLIDSVQSAAASALAMPLPPTNLMKGMSENRLVILLKDVLSDDTLKFGGAKHTFAEAFAAMMKGATCRTSRYNSNACFTLCDFLEEALMIYNDFETPENPKSYIDWTFWFDVCKKVLTSLNTMSEVRMLSFIYTIWDAVAKDPKRKLLLCRDWLLTEETFNAFFNNWCPMVRAYYQRLLCWRICRDRGSLNEVDLEIFLLAAERLKTVWSHYIYLKQTADEAGRMGPSTAPMSPTLGKKFIIIRQEINAPQPGLFMGFDSFAKMTGTDLLPGDGISDGNLGKGDGKKRWSLLGKVLSLTGNNSSQGSAADGVQARHSVDEDLQSARREVAESRLRSGPTPPPKSTKSSDSGRSSPIFEEPKYVFKFILGWQQPPMPLRERVLVRPRLPTPAQARVSVRSRGGSPPLPPASLPAPMRTVSGGSQGGLIHAARNASPLDSPPSENRRRSSSISFNGPLEESSVAFKPIPLSGTTTPRSDRLASFSSVSSSGIMFEAGQVVESITQPIKPAGIYQKTSVYSGRSLAEWSLVIAECNNFVERRRDEGVLGLNDVEVPLLTVEGFRKVNG
ncbi:UPF0592 membrane C7D4.03c-like protein [Cladobotryum mycophilum]|uniref:UPF0592 membrane C7D4.03c-like protein n=1 Tax=Cladobotryum mycophilum TaxID=491253 RepID=A0ABR0S5G0_9HYPO